jgi:hypothetical protein
LRHAYNSAQDWVWSVDRAISSYSERCGFASLEKKHSIRGVNSDKMASSLASPKERMSVSTVNLTTSLDSTLVHEEVKMVEVTDGRCKSMGLSRYLVAALFAILGMQAFAQVSWLPSGNTLLQGNDLPPSMGNFLQAMGNRMTTPTTAQVMFAGTTTDQNGSRAAQIVVQSPGYISYREGTTKSITFNGSQLAANSGTPSASDERIAESLMAHIPDTVFLQVATGGGLRRVGSHFRADASNSKTYTGPYWTLFAFSPYNRQGLTRGQALQQELFVCVDESTGLIDEIRVAVNTGSSQRSVIQTQFSGWNQQGGQWYPAKIVRLENGTQTLSFTVTQAATGIAAAITAFAP